nr:RagB/SusD family nutrient uptake outer membrane protein [Flavobacterium sp. ASV13]
MKPTIKKYHSFFTAGGIKIFYLLSIFFCSCDSFVETDMPKSQLNRDNVFEDYLTANAAMADVFSKVRDRGVLTGTQFGLNNYLGNYTDELTFYGSAANATSAFYTNTVLPSNSTLALFWNNSYNQIYASNSVLEGVLSSELSSREKSQLEGEALFVRGLLHFYLLQLFGDVPYIKSTDYKTNSTVSRMPENLVYDNIIEDLKAASVLLLPAYSSTERVRPNRFAAKALLARVCLYRKDWQQASKFSTEVIEQTQLYTFEENIDNVFLKGSTEAIWQFMPSITGKNTDEGVLFTFISGPPSLISLNQSLLNSFAVNDRRKQRWTTAVSNASGTWHYASKYKESKVSGTSKEYSVVLRLTEQYMIRAEARLKLKNTAGAVEDLNKIRKRAGLPDVEISTEEEIMDVIIKERRKEFFTEYGHRFFDLKRTDRLDAVLNVKPGWNTSDRLLPIPESEFIVNPNLGSQNPH